MSKHHGRLTPKEQARREATIREYLNRPRRPVAPLPPVEDSEVHALVVTDSIPQDDGHTRWRLQYIPRATAAAMNVDHLTRLNILARRAQPVCGSPQPDDGRDYGMDDAISEAAAARWDVD